MEKEQTPENSTDTKSEEPQDQEQQPADKTSTESADNKDVEQDIEQVDPTPEPEHETAPEPEHDTAPEPEPEPVSEPAPEPVSETPGGPSQPPPDLTVSQLTKTDPLNKTLAYGGFFLLMLAILLVGSSLMNTSRYYVTERDGAVEVWQGRFSPKAKELLIIMPGMEPPKQIKEVYTRDDVYPIIFQYYLEKSDALLDVPGLPDFSGIKAYLDKAMTYATAEEERQAAQARLESIQLSIMLYRADISAGKGTMAGLKAAQAYLGLASELNPDEIESRMIRQKLESIERMKTALAVEEAEKEKDQTVGAAPPAGTVTDQGAPAKSESKKSPPLTNDRSESVKESESEATAPTAEGKVKEQSF